MKAIFFKSYFVAATFFMISLFGCEIKDPISPTNSAKTPAGKLKIFRPVSDIPIPKDATLDPERSLILSGANDWTGRLVMRSSVSASEAFAFFKSEMPRFGWRPIMTVQAAISVLSFTRSSRAATQQIERQTLGGTLVTVTVSQSQRTES